MSSGNSTNWKWALKGGVGFVVVILVATSIFGGNEQAEFALRVLLQWTIIGYGVSEGYQSRYRTVPMLAAVLVILGGCYGWYLVWTGNEAFTNLLYLGLVGGGLLGIRVRNTR